VPRNDSEHKGAQAKLGRDIQIRPMREKRFDDGAVAGVRSQHESRLSIAIARVCVLSALKKLADGVGVSSFDRLLPSRIHSSALSGEV
jgi:hypothetical protein